MDNNLNNDDFNMQPNNNLNLNNQNNNDTNTMDNYNNQILVGDVTTQADSVSTNEEVDTIFSEEPKVEQPVSTETTPQVQDVQPEPVVEEAVPLENPQAQMMQQVQTESVSSEPVEPVKEKSNKGPIVIIIILLILILGIGGYIAYDKFFANNKPAPAQTQNEDKKEEINTVKTKDDYYVRLDPTKEIDIYNRVVGKFKINGKSNDVKITKNDDNTYTLTIGEKKIFTENPSEAGLPDFIALMNEKYVAAFFQGASNNEIHLYDLNGNKVETLGNSFGEINKIDNINDVIDKLIVDDKNLTYYECKFNNGVDTETLTEYSVTFDKETYSKDATSVKQNVTCLIGG